jgi:hypothetical protein
MAPLTFEVEGTFLMAFLEDIQKFSEVTSVDILTVQIGKEEITVPVNGYVTIDGGRLFFKKLIHFLYYNYQINCISVPILVQMQIIGKEWLLACTMAVRAGPHVISGTGETWNALRSFFLTFYEEKDLIVYKMMSDITSDILQRPVC